MEKKDIELAEEASNEIESLLATLGSLRRRTAGAPTGEPGMLTTVEANAILQMVDGLRVSQLALEGLAERLHKRHGMYDGV